MPPIIPDNLRGEWQMQLRHALTSSETSPPAETQRVTRDGRRLWVLRTATRVQDADGAPIGVLDTLVDVTALRQVDEESRALAQVRERELIAMDLHDGLIQALYGTLLNIATYERTASDDRALNALTHTRREIEQVIQETRAYMLELRAREFAPPNIETGLRLLADALRINSAIDARLSIDPVVEAQLDAETRRHVLYLVREAVSNVLRHAQASCVTIELRMSAACLHVVVEDNGIGFTPQGTSAPARQGGLHNMAERARLLGARLQLTSAPGQGTRVLLDVPPASRRNTDC
jgi:signal transduction histidine kinase